MKFKSNSKKHKKEYKQVNMKIHTCVTRWGKTDSIDWPAFLSAVIKVIWKCGWFARSLIICNQFYTCQAKIIEWRDGHDTSNDIWKQEHNVTKQKYPKWHDSTHCRRRTLTYLDKWLQKSAINILAILGSSVKLKWGERIFSHLSSKSFHPIHNA